MSGKKNASSSSAAIAALLLAAAILLSAVPTPCHGFVAPSSSSISPSSSSLSASASASAPPDPQYAAPPPPDAAPSASSTGGGGGGGGVGGGGGDPYVGDADRLLRHGMALERAGLARAAAAAFHEAATLYQCFLDHHALGEAVASAAGGAGAGASSSSSASDSLDALDVAAAAIAAAAAIDSNEFGHVTSLRPSGPDSCPAVLAYACVRLAHLSHDALGDPNAARRLYRDATEIDPQPSSVAYDGMGTAIEASGGDLKDAADAYRTALSLNPTGGSVMFKLAVALERLDRTDESDGMFERLRRGGTNLSCLVDSWGYVRWHARKVPPASLNLHRGTRDMLRVGLEAARDLIENENGLVCEFGVGTGRSARMIQEMVPLDVPVHGFDTFTGLPTSWNDEPAGSYSTGGTVPNVEGEVHFHKGLFRDTVPTFLAGTERYQPLAFANVDCDLYGSTVDVLEGLYSRVVPGTVLVFDEYLCHPTWRQDEFRAWRECCKRFGWSYEYLAFSLSTKQAVVRVTDA